MNNQSFELIVNPLMNQLLLLCFFIMHYKSAWKLQCFSLFLRYLLCYRPDIFVLSNSYSFNFIKFFFFTSVHTVLKILLCYRKTNRLIILPSFILTCSYLLCKTAWSYFDYKVARIIFCFSFMLKIFPPVIFCFIYMCTNYHFICDNELLAVNCEMWTI
jgi:hypothetical protein